MASPALSIGKVSEIKGLILPPTNILFISTIFRWFVAASRPVKLPQKTPTSDAPFKRVKLIGNLGICPAAKPTTRYLPFQPIDLNAGSV